MLDTAIKDFLESKKLDFLKKKIKSNTSEENKLKFIKEANTEYDFQAWLERMVSIADSYCSTHPVKYSHSTPLSKSSKYKAKDMNMVVYKSRGNDGLLRTGNVEVEIDFTGYPDNGRSTELYVFLHLHLQDGKSITEHMKEGTDYIKEQLHFKNIKYRKISDSFLPTSKHSKVTSERLKQVYFPVNEDYHLLTVLTPSGVIYKLKEQINELRFSQENKRLRDEIKKSTPEPTKGKVEEIFDLTHIGYGGTNAQNVSVLNNQNGGVSFLLSSAPPILNKRKIQPPKKSFFIDCLWPGFFKDDFKDFHKILDDIRNNIDIRDKRDDIVLNSIYKTKWLFEQIRDIGSNWSDSETYSGLEPWEKIWLDEKYQSIRGDNNQNNDYIDKAQSHFANWFIGSYKQTIKDNKLLGNDDIDHIKEVLKQEQELLA